MQEYPKKGRDAKGANKGFTLMELLIAIVLVGFIIVIITGAMRLAYRSVERGDRKIDSLERFRTSLTIVDAQIQSAVPLKVMDNTLKDSQAKETSSGALKEYYFEGRHNGLTLTTNYSVWGGESGYVLVEYNVETDENGMKNLSVKESMVGKKNVQETLLFKGVNSITFDYYFADVTEESGKWIEEWTDTTTIPQKVRFRIVAGKRDISLIIPLRAHGIVL